MRTHMLVNSYFWLCRHLVLHSSWFFMLENIRVQHHLNRDQEMFQASFKSFDWERQTFKTVLEGCAIKFLNNDSVQNELKSILRCHLNRSSFFFSCYNERVFCGCFHYDFGGNRTLRRLSFSLGDENSWSIKCSPSDEVLRKLLRFSLLCKSN